MSTSLMALGVRALAANYAALQTTGHNIANANVAGYSRQTTQLATAQGQYTGAGFYGRGVDVVTVQRSHDEFLTREAANATSLKSMDSARLTQLKYLETVFQTGETGIGQATSQFFASLTDLTSMPGDLATREVVLARAGALATRFSDAAGTLDDIQIGVNAEVQTAVTSINSLAKGIADINQKIGAMRGLGQPANDLLDERDRLIGKLSEQIQVNRVEAGDGTVSLFIAGGQRLVLGNEVAELKAVRDPTDPTRSALGIVEGSTVRQLDAAALGGGTVAGLLRFQNEDLSEGRRLLGEMALQIAGAVNGQQQRGLTLTGAQGSDFFKLSDATAQPDIGNARAANGSPLGTVTFQFQSDAPDYTAQHLAGYTLVNNGGSWDVTRLSDGSTVTVPNGGTIDGLKIDGTGGVVGDRFTLQPALRAASGMAVALGGPRDIAAASPLTATAPAANTGTLAVGALKVTANPLPAAGETLTFTPSATPGSFDVTSSLSGPMGTWKPGQTLVSANGYELTLTGVPDSSDGTDDSIVVGLTGASALASSNGNALSLLALRSAKLAGGQTAIDQWAHTLSQVGVRVQAATSTADASAAVAQQAEQSRTAQSGVNLDEEAARLIQFQQSYQAAAKVLQVAQALFDSLMSATNG